jgi:light-regulated signal transduction histidine kinase (bacteriophytochrome)
MQIEQQESDYDIWFRKEVEEGLREADDPNTVTYTNDEVMQHMDDLLNRWEETAAGRKAS